MVFNMKEEPKMESHHPSSGSCCELKKRNILVFMLAFGVFNVFSLRNGINVAILAMTRNPQNLTGMTNVTRGSTCRLAGSVTDHRTQDGEFDWDMQKQTLVLAAYFYGYLVGNIPSAYLLRRFGIRMVFGVNGIASSIITILMPVLARTHFGLLVAARALVGFFQAGTFPTVMHAFSIWTPRNERSRHVSLAFSGMSVGNVIIMMAGGVICSALGWEAIFYLSGAVGLLWSIVWVAIIRNTPDDHPCITQQERDYIRQNIDACNRPSIPWKQLLKSFPVLIIFAAHVSDNWSTYSLTALGPIYINRVQGFDLKSAGILSALPFIVRLVITLIWGGVADVIIRRYQVTDDSSKSPSDKELAKQKRTRLIVRKISSSFPLTAAGVSLCLVAFLGCNTWPVIVLLTFSVGILGMTTSGHLASYLDVTGDYSSTIFALANTLISALGFLSPQVAGAMLPNNSLENWRNVFLLASGISICGSLLFAIFGTTDLEAWAKSTTRDDKEQALVPLKAATQCGEKV